MAKRYQSNERHPIIKLMLKADLGKQNICKALNLDRTSFDTYLNRPLMFRLEHLVMMAGLFGISTEEIVYRVLRNNNKVNATSKWYIEEIRERNK